MLNKFAIVPGHFILATREFKPQGWLLEEGDLAVGVACLGVYDCYSSFSSVSSSVSGSSSTAAATATATAAAAKGGGGGGGGGVEVDIGGGDGVEGGGGVEVGERGGSTKEEEGRQKGEEQEKGEEKEKEREKLFIFFNSGVHSGASQPHRHLQLLPVDAMREGLEEIIADDSREGDQGKQKWDVVASQLVDDRNSRSSAKGDKRSREGRVQLPFRAFVECIHVGMDGAALRAVYLRLYRQACQAMGVSDDEILDEGEARISYNLAMTSKVMVLAPRVAEGAEVTKDGEVVGKLALNGTVLAGTGLVKTQAEWDALRQDPDQVARVLRSIGLPTQSRRVSSKTKI